MIVLDSSAAVEALRGTDESRAIQEVLQSDEEVVSCDLFRVEMASVMRKFARTGIIDAAQANYRLNDAIDLVNRFYSLEDLQAEALAESIRLDHSVYDMFYFVLARRAAIPKAALPPLPFPAPVRASAATLFKSELDSEGAIYTPLHTIEFA